MSPIAYYPSIATFLDGDVAAAIMVCRFLSWRHQAGDEGTCKTRREIQKETGISEEIQRRVCKRLIKRGFLEIEKRGLPARNYYIWNWDAFEREFFSAMGSGETDFGFLGKREGMI